MTVRPEGFETDEPPSSTLPPGVDPNLLRELPKPACVEGALIGPFSEQSSKFRQAFEAWTGDVILQHLRLGKGDELFDINEVTPADPEHFADAPLIPGAAVYAGPFMNHFGHMVADGMHRLWAVTVYPELRDAAIVFQVKPGRNYTTPPWFLDILAIFGISPAQILPISGPTRFERLYIPRQGRVLGGKTLIENYAKLFPIRPLVPEQGSAAKLYISRLKHRHTGSYLGETLIETLLARSGFEIVTPEETSLDALLRKFVGAELIVFSEGSAIHNLELTGRIAARAFVIGRRGGTEDRFGPILSTACSEWRVHEDLGATVVLDWDKRRNGPARARGCSFVDLPALVRALAEFGGVALPVPDDQEARDAASLDLLAYLLDRRSGDSSDDEHLGRALRRLRNQPAVRALLADD